MAFLFDHEGNAMLHRRSVWCALIAAVVLASVASMPAKASVVDGSLLYLDAADAQGNDATYGVTWHNKGSLGETYSATLGIAGDGSVTWAGTGVSSDPYTLQVRSGSDKHSGGYAQVANTYYKTNALDSTIYTYEVWAKIVGPGSDDATYMGTNGGTLMGHNTRTTGQGNGSIGYAINADATGAGFQANSLYTQSGAASGAAAYQTTFPNSTDLVGAGYHQIVLTRAGSGATDTNWYQDGVLKGTWQTDSNASEDSWFLIGGRNWSTDYNMFASADIAIARVYGTALTGSQVAQNYGADYATFGLSPLPTPEPASLVATVTGVLGMIAYAWRKRK
jgi:microcompartment protein CcmK/EutM